MLFLATVAQAAEPGASWTTLQQNGVLRIGTTGDYAPYTARDAAGGWAGADIALGRELALAMGLRAEFIPTTWRSLQDDFTAGRFDIALGGISITEERRRFADFSAPYLRDAKQPVVRCGEQRRFDSRAEIDSPAVRLIVNPGGTNEAFARREFPRAMLKVHDGNLGVFERIRAGEADVMVTDGVEAKLQQRRGVGLCAAKVSRAWAPAGKAVLLPHDPMLRKVVDETLRRTGGARAYGARLESWLDLAALPAQGVPEQMAALIDERLALVTEVARYKWNTGAAIEDPPREQALLASLRERAGALGLAQARVDAFFIAQIEAAKQLQTELFARWQREHREKFPGIADLATQIRPGIDRVTSAMLEALARWPADGQLPAASTMRGISAEALNIARAPLGRSGGT